MTGASAIKAGGGAGDEWLTPLDLWGEMREEFFPNCDFFDPCPSKFRALPFTVLPGLIDDGLASKWAYRTFINPPFSNIEPWIEKAYKSHSEFRNDFVLILPVRSDQWWWHRYAMMGQIIFIQGRVNYELPQGGKTAGASFPSCLVLFGDGIPKRTTGSWWPECHRNRRKRL